MYREQAPTASLCHRSVCTPCHRQYVLILQCASVALLEGPTRTPMPSSWLLKDLQARPHVRRRLQLQADADHLLEDFCVPRCAVPGGVQVLE